MLIFSVKKGVEKFCSCFKPEKRPEVEMRAGRATKQGSHPAARREIERLRKELGEHAGAKACREKSLAFTAKKPDSHPLQASVSPGSDCPLP